LRQVSIIAAGLFAKILVAGQSSAGTAALFAPSEGRTPVQGVQTTAAKDVRPLTTHLQRAVTNASGFRILRVGTTLFADALSRPHRS
jgi:hypothetical protein